MSLSYKTQNILILYGDDVSYDNIDTARSQVQLIKDIQPNDQSMNITFATITDYFQAVMSENQTYSVFEGDFYPYISKHLRRRSISWTGFYSSRPALKQKIFEAHSLVRAAEIVSALVLHKRFQGYEASLSLHHDAITGTCRPEVANDYFQRLYEDIKASEGVIRYSYSNIVTCSVNPIEIMEPYKAYVIYNPVNWEFERVLGIESNSMHVAVHDSKGNVIPSQSLPYFDRFKIYFKVSLPPLSFITIFLSEQTMHCSLCSDFINKTEITTINNGIYTLEFEKGLIKTISTDSSSFEISENIVRYEASPSGAYEFRPMVLNK